MSDGSNAGRYAIYGEIASGGMASVHLGRLVGLASFSRTIAIKRLHPQFAKDPDFVAMFLDEARVAARVRHPNVVPVIDVVSSNGELFLVMEYVEGESLAKIIRERVRIPLPIASAIVCGMLHGLHAAHEAVDEQGAPLSIVHRDVSPQNVLVGRDGASRVFDFGVAKAIGRSQTTRDGQLKGKIGYMSPEQLRGKPLDRRSDLFAAGVVLWEVLTTERLFQGDSEAEVFGKILEEPVPPPSSRVPELPPELDALVRRALQRTVEKRFQTAREMALAFEAIVRPATAAELGAWLESRVAETLNERAARVAEIERGAVEPLPVDVRSTVTARLEPELPTRVETPRRRGFALVAVVGVACLGLGALATTQWPHASADPAPVSSPSATPAKSVESVASVVVPPPQPPPSESVSAKPVIKPLKKTTVVTKKPKATGANCYQVGPNGIVTIAKECL